jgi:hypothetical protein
MVDNGKYEQLGFAIVEDCMIDYEKALASKHDAEIRIERCLKALAVAYKKRCNADAKIRECEQFFNGKDCALYTSNLKGVNGSTIMEQAKENVRKCEYDKNQLKQLHNSTKN